METLGSALIALGMGLITTAVVWMLTGALERGRVVGRKSARRRRASAPERALAAPLAHECERARGQTRAGERPTFGATAAARAAIPRR